MFHLCHHVSLVLQWFLVPYCWLVAGKSRRFPSVDVIEKEICALDLVELAQETLADVASSLADLVMAVSIFFSTSNLQTPFLCFLFYAL